MGKQQENKISPRQSVYNDLGLEKNNVTYDQFSKMFDENEDFRKSVYNDLGFEGQGVNYDKFYSIMGKPTEVSPQGLANTSQTPVEPTQNIDQSQELPTQQNGDLSNQSLDTATPEVPEQNQVQIPEGFRDAGGGNLIPVVNRQGTWREPFEGDFSYDVQGYEVYTPTPKAVSDAGGWDNMVKFFREQQPNTLLAPPFDPNSPESEQSVGELSGQYINEDVAKPTNLDALVKERELSKKPFEEWSKDDQLDFYLSRIAQMNIEAGTAPKEEEDGRNAIIEQQATERRNEDRGVVGTFADFIGTALRGFGRGSTRLLADVLDVPEFVYDALSNITNEPTFREKYGDEFLGQISDYLRGAVSRDELYNSIRFGDEGVTDSFLKGNIEDGVNKLVGSTTESLPIMLTLSAGNPSALTSTLSMGAGQYNQLQQANPDMDLSTKMINATLTMYAEMIPEKIGADAVFKPFYDLYKKSGKEVAEKALSSFMRKLGGRFGVLTPSATEAITEGATNTMNNLIAKYSGEDPNRKLNDGLNDALLIGGTSGGVIAAPAQVANSIADKKVRGKVQSLAKENIDIEISLNDKKLPEDIRERLIDRYTKNTETINGYVEQQIEDKGRLNSKQKEIVNQLEASKARVNALIGDENVPESVQTNAQAEVDSINDQIYKLVTTKAPDENLSTERVDKLVESNRDRFPELNDIKMGEVEVDDVVFDTLSKIESGESINEADRQKSIDSLYEKKKELKELLRDPNRSHTSKEINDALSLIDKDLDTINEFQPDISSADFSLIKPGDKFAQGEVKSASVSPDGGIDVVFTNGNKINSNEEGIQVPGEVSVEGADQQTGQTEAVVNESENRLKELFNNLYSRFRNANILDDGFAMFPFGMKEVVSKGLEGKFFAHGMGKSGFGSAVNDLLKLFNNGIDPNRGPGYLYTAPLEGAGEASSGIGAGSAYADGVFILVSSNPEISNINQVEGILVNDGIVEESPEVIEQLKARFPNLEINRFSEAGLQAEILNNKNEQTIQEPVEPVTETGPENQNVDAQPDEIDMSLVPPRPEPQEVQTTARTQMEPISFFANTDEYQRSLAEQSNNPDEIAYEYARTEIREADPIEQGIIDYMGSGRINAKDFAEYGDSNWLEDMDAQTRRRWINSDNTEGLSLDQMAQELSSNLNMEVTPEDIIGVIMDFRGRSDFDASRKTEGQKALEHKYKELTGKNLTPYVARRTADMMDRRAAELTDEQRASVDENLQDLGITYQDILDYEEFNRQIAESGPGGLQQPQVNQGTVSQSRAQDSGAQEGQTGQVEDSSTGSIRESFERLTEGMTPEQIESDPDLVRMRNRISQTQPNESQTESTHEANERKKVPAKKEQKVAESSKVEAKRRESALSGTPSKIREGIKVPSDLPGSRGSAIAGDAFNDAADVTARAIDNGSSLDEAISQGIDNMKKSYWYRTLPKDSKKQAEQSFRDAINGANEMVYAEQNPSAKNSRSQKLREKYGFGDRIIPETQGSSEILAEARADIREGRVFPIDVVNKGLSGKQLTAKEQAIIVEYMNQLEAEVALQSDRIENDNTMTPEAFNEVDKMREEALNKLSAAIYALERTGTEIARALASRKWIVNRDVSLPSMISMKRKVNGNVPLTTEQLETVRREFDAIMKDKTRVDKRMAEIEAELASAKADIVMMAEAKKAELEYRKTKDKAGSKKEALTDIQARRAEAKQALKDAVGKITNLGFAYNPKQQAQHDADFLSALGTLLKTYFDEALLRSGKVNYNAIINNITRDLQDAHPNITKEQVAQMIDALDTDTRPTLQSLRAEVASLKEEIKTHNLESEKQSIRRRINNINEKIKAKDYKTVPSGLEKYDAEYRQLKKQLDDRIYEFKVEMERDKLRRRGLLHKAFSYSSEIFALPRALMATGDLSAPLRQGIVAMVGNPRTGIKAFKEMHKMALNEAYYEAYHEAVRDSEMYDLATRSGLSLSGVGNNVWTTLREEQWTSRLINKVPVLKHVAAFSERGFAGFLNKMRFDLFNQGAELLLNEGKSFQTHPDQFKAVATYVNAVTGRGPVPSRWEGMFGDLSTALFAPRLITSRLYLLLGGPIVSAARSGNWNVAKSYAKDMAGFISFGIGTMFLASMLDGVSIEGDDEDEPLFTQGAADTWTKGDFLNIRVGDTRYDIWGGFAQYIRLFARVMTGQTTSSSGKVKIAADAKSIGDTELGWILRFGQSKLSPTAAFAVGFLSHRNYMGDPFNPVNELQNMAWPLVFQETVESMFGPEDTWENIKGMNIQNPTALASVFLPSAYGVGVQTWSSNSFLKNGIDNKIIDVLTKKKLNTMSKRQQDVTVIEPSTGESRKVTDEEFVQYKKVWDDYVKNELNKNLDKIEKMSESKAEKEFNNIKRAATVLAKKSITGVSSDDTRIQFDKKTYDLDGDVLKRRLRYMDEYREANGNRYNTQYPKELKRENPSITPEEIKISIEKQMDKDARSYSREKILDDYVKGRIKLVEN